MCDALKLVSKTVNKIVEDIIKNNKSTPLLEIEEKLKEVGAKDRIYMSGISVDNHIDNLIESEVLESVFMNGVCILKRGRYAPT